MKRTSDFHVRMSGELSDRIALLANERGVSRNVVIVSAVEDFLNIGEGSKAREQALEGLRKDVFEVKRRVSALREDVEILGELLSFFIYHWIGYTPKLEKEERLSLAAEAKERHDRFLSLFAKKLAVGDLALATIVTRSEEFKRARGEGVRPSDNTESASQGEVHHEQEGEK
jgi:hypothetical protein